MPGKHLLVSGFFGTPEIDIYDAPKGTRALFFTNNEKTAAVAKIANWEPYLINRGDLALSSDVRVSSIQSKYIKFLQFRRDFPELKNYQMVTYCDHHACIQDKQLLEIFTHMDMSKSVLIRSSPRKKGLLKEIEISRRQPRYDNSMNETIRWIDYIRTHEEISDTQQIANTGIIHTIRVDKMMSLFDSVYKAVIKLNQPQCQILWVVLSQKYAFDIQQVNWHDLDIPWGAPVINRYADVK